MQLDKEHRSAQHYQQMAEDAKTPLSVAQAEIESLKKELLVAHRHELQLNREVKTSFGDVYVLGENITVGWFHVGGENSARERGAAEDGQSHGGQGEGGL